MINACDFYFYHLFCNCEMIKWKRWFCWRLPKDSAFGFAMEFRRNSFVIVGESIKIASILFDGQEVSGIMIDYGCLPISFINLRFHKNWPHDVFGILNEDASQHRAKI